MTPNSPSAFLVEVRGSEVWECLAFVQVYVNSLELMLPAS